MTTEEKKSKSKVVSIFAILGFALLLLVAIWSTVQVVKFVPRMFGGETIKLPSINLGGSDKLKVSLSKLSVKSGTPIDITWKFKTKKEGIMSFSYGCEPGFHFRLPGVDANSYTVLPCNAPYNIPSKDKSITVIPVSDSNRYMDAALAITFTDASGKSVRDVANITVENTSLTTSPDTMSKTKKADTVEKDATVTIKTENTNLFKKAEKFTGSTKGMGNAKQTAAAATTVTKKVVRYVTVPVAPTSNPSGMADLQLKILSVGAIDPYTGTFVPKGTIRTNERAAVQFEVTNMGDKATGSWTYSAELPTYPHYIYASKYQASLMPGAKATITVAFDKLATGRATVAIHADQNNSIHEINENNNAGARYFSIY